MATKQELQAQERLKAQANANGKFIALSYEQPVKAIAQGGNLYQPGATLNYQVPFIAGGWANRIILKYKIKLDITKGSGQAKLNAGAPYNLVSSVNVVLGNLTHKFNPVLTKILDQMSGYAQGEQAEARGTKDPEVDSLLYTIPKTLEDGENEFNFFASFDFNQMNNASVVGLLPLYSTGTPLQISLNLANSVVGNDPLDNVISLSGGATLNSVGGTIDVICMYRDHNSMFTTEAIQPIMDGLPTINTIQIPTLSPLTANVWNGLDIKNPMKHIKTISILIDGKSSERFASNLNIDGFSIDKAGNNTSSWIKYSEETGGYELYLESIRNRFGQDLDPGVIVFDSTTMNQEDAANKKGMAALNLSVYPAGRFQYRVKEVGNSLGITPRVVTFSVVVNEGGIS